MSKLTLLEKALASNHVRKTMQLTEEELELVVAWLEGKISLTQLTIGADLSSQSVGYAFIANGCKQIWNGKKTK